MALSGIEHALLSYVPIPILKLLFPLNELHRQRDRPLRVLCLGLGRTGTDSLRSALLELGYDEVAHGWYFMTEENIRTGIQVERLFRAKLGPFPDPAFLQGPGEFDKVIGSCMATTDQPMASLGVELLRAYPDAKVILNRRNDSDAWVRSQIATLDKIKADWRPWAQQWFDAEEFWIGRMLYWILKQTKFDFARYSKQWYREHYAALEAELRGQGREWLDWEVQDGWEPICRLLGHEVPTREFPNENASGGWDKRQVEVHKARNERADARMRRTVVMVVAAVMAGVGWYVYRLMRWQR